MLASACCLSTLNLEFSRMVSPQEHRYGCTFGSLAESLQVEKSGSVFFSDTGLGNGESGKEQSP